MKKYTCRVCGKRFTDLMVHLNKNEKKLLIDKPKFLSLDRRDIKPDHLDMYEKIDINWSEEKCFCGGDIVAYSCGDEGNPLVEVSCNRCGFLWDE